MNYSTLDKDVNFTSGPFPFDYNGWNDRFDWHGALHARLGLAQDRNLFYVLGGPSLINHRLSSATANVFAPGFNPADYSKAHLGFEFGLGFERAVSDRLSIKAEYVHGEYGSVTMQSDADYNVKSRLRTDAAMLGLSYHF